jgi:hypothetical protein
MHPYNKIILRKGCYKPTSFLLKRYIWELLSFETVILAKISLFLYEKPIYLGSTIFNIRLC